LGILSLAVNDVPVKTDHFVAGFIVHAVVGMIEILKGAAKIDNLTVVIDGNAITIILNGKHKQTNVFAGWIIKSTVDGIIAPLKDVQDAKKRLSVLVNKT
jgi:hypothetical protein